MALYDLVSLQVTSGYSGAHDMLDAGWKPDDNLGTKNEVVGS